MPATLAARRSSDPERPAPDLMSPVKTQRVPGPLRHQPHWTPVEGFLERPAMELLPFRGMALRAPRHDPTGMAQRAPHRPPARAPTMHDRRSQSILQGAAFDCRMDAGVRNRAGGARRIIPGEDRTINWAHEAVGRRPRDCLALPIMKGTRMARSSRVRASCSGGACRPAGGTTIC